MSNVWFVTFRFPVRMDSREHQNHKIKEWIRRLIQSLELEEDQVFVSYLFGEEHAHLVIQAPGLEKLDQKKWEWKWEEITGKKVISNQISHTSICSPGVVRRRQGEEKVVSYIRKSFTEVVPKSEIVKYTHSGSCRIRQEGSNYVSRSNRTYTCSLDGIEKYLVQRHSREMMNDYHFVGLNA